MEPAVKEPELREGLPSAWAVWEAWQGPPGQVAAIARQVVAHLGTGECVVELDVEGGQQRIEAEHVETDLAPRYRRSFERMTIRGTAPGLSVEAEFDNERRDTPARGVALRVWSPDPDRALAVRDSIAVAIDGSRTRLASKPQKGPPSDLSVDQALRKADRTYRIGAAVIVSGLVGWVVFAAAIAHRLVDPASDIGRILLFCLCGGDRKIAMAIYFVAVVVAALVVAPRVLPPIEISDRSTWSRGWRWLLGVVGGTLTLGSGLEVLANGLPA